MKIKYLLLFAILNFGCKTENKINVLNHEKKLEKDTVFETQEIDYFQYKEYKVGHVNDGWGKRLYIDSLNFNIVKLFYKSDSTKLQFEFFHDFVNDTKLKKEYFKNGGLKLVEKTTYHNFIPIGIWKYYKSNGELSKEINYDDNFKVSFEKAMMIAKQNGIKKPYETELSNDSLYWKIWNWKTIEFDSMGNRGVREAKGIMINRANGQIEKIKSKSEFEI